VAAFKDRLDKAGLKRGRKLGVFVDVREVQGMSNGQPQLMPFLQWSDPKQTVQILKT